MELEVGACVAEADCELGPKVIWVGRNEIKFDDLSALVRIAWRRLVRTLSFQSACWRERWAKLSRLAPGSR